MDRVPTALSRTSSTMSACSTASTDSRDSLSRACTKNASATNADIAKRTRRRFTHAQLSMLETLYHETSHPSREQRERVAAEGAMEIKSVTIWFQNKRQTERRMAVLLAKDATHEHPSTHIHTHTHTHQKTTAPLGPRPSLERVASLSELRAPHTPRAHRTAGHGTMPWDNMPSSPSGPTSPAARESEYVEFGSRRTLEWACARHRVRRRTGAPHAQSDDTDVDEPHEAITPRSSISQDRERGPQGLARKPTMEEVLMANEKSGALDAERTLESVDEEDWKAALVLCGLGRS
ncbi:hypothetical protein K525DRAFT_279415 [Schizophyllum commune Loenen D]|nr:hypothetical protein K525DRAFT_279415 [Schizophyllum commune Loenen D]